MKCQVCGKVLEDDTVYCTSCGNKVKFESNVEPKKETERPLRKRHIAMALAFLLGGVGLHHYYLGFYKKFYIKLGISAISFGVLLIPVAIWAIVEGIIIGRNLDYRDAWGRLLC